MHALIQNLINGNLTDAKRQARFYSSWELRDALQDMAGYSEHKAELTADWLHGRDCWREACDA